jgi:curved DNA-binding protein CbpA
MLLHSIPRLSVCRDCLKVTQPQLLLQTQITSARRQFHSSRRRLQDVFTNHYDTLELPSSASPGDIKKQFYALSKKYHPDVNHDPSASEKFVKISEAYHVVGSSEKRGKYDRDLQRAHAPQTRSGSHHSSHARGPAGGRPASGLSRRRSHFRGPPPSFYAQGAYGTTGAKRQRAQTEANARSSSQHDEHGPGSLGSKPNYEGTGGFSPGDDSSYYPDPNLPYFDKASHRRTHDNLGARRERIDEYWAQKQAERQAERQGSLIGNFIIVTAVVVTATVAATAVVDLTRAASSGSGRKRENG